MVTLDIEMEIKKEHKVFWGFTLRQIIFCIGLGLPIIVANFIFEWPTFVRISTAIFIACAIYMFAFRTFSGLPFERYVAIKIKKIIYGNSVRNYRTRNHYITVLNSYYNDLKTADMANKKKKKYIKKMSKQKRKLKSKLKAYA